MSAEIGEISVFLAKDGRTFDTVFDADRNVTKAFRYKAHDFRTDGTNCRVVYFESQSQKSNPPWLDFVNEKIPAADRVSFSAKSLGANGILLIESDKRVFVALFGRSASSYIDKHALERDFGIKTAMNMCGNEELRQTRTQSNSIAITNIDRQVSKPADAFSFGLSEAEDLRYISAHLKDKKHITLQGRDNLTIKVLGTEKLNWTRLIDYCKTFLKNFSAKDYVALFPNYRNFDPATDAEATALDAALISTLQNKDFSKLQLCIPEFLADNEYSYSYSNHLTKENTVYAYLQADQLAQELDLNKITIKKLIARRIYAYSAVDSRILEHKNWDLYDCIVFEHAIGARYFVLSEGRWLRVESSFYNKIIDFTKNGLREIACDAWCKDIDISDDKKYQNREGIFNAKIVELRKSCVLFDTAKLRIGGGRKDKEFCDILDMQDDGVVRIINSKQYKDSASINYLFTQTKFYCSHFLGDQVFLGDIRDHIKSSQCDIAQKKKYLDYVKPLTKDVHGQDYRIALWFLYDKREKKPKKDNLPLAAQFELKLMHDYLQSTHKFKEIVICYVPVLTKQYIRKVKPKPAAAKPMKAA